MILKDCSVPRASARQSGGVSAAIRFGVAGSACFELVVDWSRRFGRVRMSIYRFSRDIGIPLLHTRLAFSNIRDLKWVVHWHIVSISSCTP